MGEVGSVVLSIAVLCLVTGCLWIAALNTEFSEKLMRNFCLALIGAIFLQLTFMLMMWTGQGNFWVYYGYCALGIFITGAYIIVDLIYIMAPGALDLDDYILGALMLYVDLV